jgi:hypothetical protein
LKNSLFVPISQNLGDRKCLGDPRKSIVGHPDAILFLSILREGVFQQPQAITLIDRATGVNERYRDISPIIDSGPCSFPDLGGFLVVKSPRLHSEPGQLEPLSVARPGHCAVNTKLVQLFYAVKPTYLLV